MTKIKGKNSEHKTAMWWLCVLRELCRICNRKFETACTTKIPHEWAEKKILSIHLSIYPYISSNVPFLAVFQIQGLFLSWLYIHFTWIYIYEHKYIFLDKQLQPAQSVCYMYVCFRDDYLVTNKQLLLSSWERLFLSWRFLVICNSLSRTDAQKWYSWVFR